MSKLSIANDHPKPKFSFMRNIVPPFFGFVIMICTFCILNAEFIAAQYNQNFSTHSISNVKLSTNKVPTDASELIIPSLNLETPIISEPSLLDSAVQEDLKHGVVRYGNLANFGSNGNVVIIGHSSGAIWAPGNFKYIFTFLDKLKIDDKITVDYLGHRYIYNVYSITIVDPTDTSVLNQPKDKKIITLITCTPVGTNNQRLIVRGIQISPR